MAQGDTEKTRAFLKATDTMSDEDAAELLHIHPRSITRWRGEVQAGAVNLRRDVRARMDKFLLHAVTAEERQVVVIVLSEVRAKLNELEAKLVGSVGGGAADSNPARTRQSLGALSATKEGAGGLPAKQRAKRA